MHLIADAQSAVARKSGFDSWPSLGRPVEQLRALEGEWASTSPMALDYLNVGKGPRTVSFGVMDVDGDEWRICMARASAPRPQDFSCGAGSGRTLSRWRPKRR